MSYKLNDTKNTKIMALNIKQLYKQVTDTEKLPFNKWNHWLGDYIQKLTLESMYTKHAAKATQEWQVVSHDRNYKI